MTVSKERVEEFKEIYKKEHGKELSDQEAQEAADNLVGLFKLLWDCSMKDAERKRRLKKEPKGFPVDNHYNCIVCYRTIDPQTGWYDHNNQKCLSCQKAVEGGALPSYVCHHRKSFFLTWELKSSFNIHPQTARKLVRQGRLVARIVKNEHGGDQEYIFLKKENPSLIERYNPTRKSYDRNRHKVSAKWGREAREKMRAERAQIEKKYRRR